MSSSSPSLCFSLLFRLIHLFLPAGAVDTRPASTFSHIWRAVIVSQTAEPENNTVLSPAVESV